MGDQDFSELPPPQEGYDDYGEGGGYSGHGPHGGAPAAGRPGQPEQTSKAAIWSLVLSIIPACITQLIAIPLAIAALVKIGNSEGRLTGTPLAVIALVICGVQVLVAPAFIAIIAAIAIPGMLRSRVGGNEASAIRTLRYITTAQEQFKQGNIVDQDGDGMGEYGWLGELSGIDACRVSGLKMNQSPYIAAILGIKDGGGLAQKSGYYFVMYLPGTQGEALREPQGADQARPEAADAQEVRWACYAWPAMPGASGNRCFFANSAGEVYATPMNALKYQGNLTIPLPGAAYEAGTGANLDGGIGLAAANLQSNDGNVWVPAGS